LISTHINNMRAKLRTGEIALGAGITLFDPTVTEALTHSVDFVWIDMEHNATTTEAILGYLYAVCFRAGLLPIPLADRVLAELASQL
jgi:2-keto-3-deoxy-L-rhamnonate aldolase RhmA